MNKRVVKIGGIMVFLILAYFLIPFIYRYYNNRNIEFRTQGNYFQIYQNGQWEDFFIKGVNMGAAKPGTFPGEMDIEKEDYLRWFEQISEMNANTLRVYTILDPAFYEAFYEYNMHSDTPLYIFHGVWMNEEAIVSTANSYAPEITEEFQKEIENLIDVLHGNKVIKARAGHASGSYRFDISPYVAGYILGIELDTEYVINTNEENKEVGEYTGEYLYTKDASPQEHWMAWMGDHTIAYEERKYGEQKPVSWVNWLTTDPLWHEAEPDAEKEDSVSVDTEHIYASDKFTAGLFAAYHIYPYYPEFMMYQPEYTSYIDKEGKVNPYEGYLKDLKAYHSVPVLVAEFGVPSSRGITHENVVTGYNQGGLTEQEQGEYTADMFESIADTDCAGGLVFSWQDEWFKRSWNTMDFDLADRRAYWSNVQVSEQMYGLLAFDPGDTKTLSQVDGNLSEWQEEALVCGDENVSLSMMSDERYVYFYIQSNQADILEHKFIIAIDSVPGQGNHAAQEFGLAFRHAVDFLISIDGEENSVILTDAYYDSYYRCYSMLDIIEKNEAYEQKDSGLFHPINLITRRHILLPLTQEYIPTQYYETGKLLHGNSNPDSDEYNSLADFYMNKEQGSIEIRIPWQLLNVADPSSKHVIGDMYADDQEFNINPVLVEGMIAELHYTDLAGNHLAGDGFYVWEAWEEPAYHERLKESYYSIQKKFGEY